jgi:hypothetical protein
MLNDVGVEPETGTFELLNVTFIPGIENVFEVSFPKVTNNDKLP